MNGKLIVIDGLDGSGKATQAQRLYDTLIQKKMKVFKYSFPNYESKSSAPVKMYLNGEISENVDDVNAFAASTFFAVDRYVSYMTQWKAHYDNGAFIILDRYTTSNAIHQAVKISPDMRDEFLDWLIDFEYRKMEIPKPDLVIYLDVNPKISQKLLEKRYNGDKSKKDIHEKNIGYINACRPVALDFAKKQGWRIIKCDDGERLMAVDMIADQILAITEKILFEK